MKRGLVIALALCAVPLMASASGGAVDMTHRMMQLAIQVGVILFAARLGNLLFTKLRLPSVLGELCAGMAIGPYALGSLCEGWIFQAFPGSSVGVSPELYGICTIASIVLLFLVGAETDLKMFMRYSAVGSLVGVGGVVFSFASGVWAGMCFLGVPWDNPACIFLGVMSTATSVSITARILSERRKLDSQEGVTILAGAVIDDVLGIIMLAIGMGMIAAQQQGNAIAWGDIGQIAGKSFGLWLGATAVGVLVARWVAKTLKRCGSRGEVAVLALGLALLVGGAFEQARLAMIIGAYVTGLAFSRTDMGVMIQEKLHGLYQFLVPTFFAVMGMMVDVTQLVEPSVLRLGLVYTAVAVLAKVVGCGLPTLCFGFNGIGALRVGLGMVPRGEVALIIAGIAGASGLLPSELAAEVLGVAVLMTLLTTLVSPPLLIAAFALPMKGLRKAFQKKSEVVPPEVVFAFPNHAITNTVTEKILGNLAQEGFFTHQIDSASGLYQARRDDLVLTFTCAENAITFTVSAQVLPFVQVVMGEALAEFEQVAEALRKPLSVQTRYDAEVQEMVEHAKVSHGQSAILARHIRERAIVHRLRANDRDGVIRELLEVLGRTGQVTDRALAEQEVFQRENAMATGMGLGVACPHARTAAVSSLVCAIGITEQPFDFSADETGKDCRIVVLTLTPDTLNSPYMTFLSAVLAVLHTTAKREAILAAPNAAAIRKVFVEG